MTMDQYTVTYIYIETSFCFSINEVIDLSCYFNNDAMFGTLRYKNLPNKKQL